jgi:DNA (cytosine-5)-methyltransferase 1
MKPTVLSLFSGIEGFGLGLERAGFELVGHAEVDPFCNKVLAARWPEVPNYGDVRSIGVGRARDHVGRESVDAEASVALPEWRRGDVDLVCGGFPCQDLSVAGKRAGLAGERSGLWFEFHRILSELRPAYALIENVPGLLSSNDGRDFAVVLAGMGELWPAVGWAVLDSQHFGVPQRRRRVYVVAGPRRESVQQVLSLCEGGDWHPAKGREAREDTAYALSAGVRGTGDGHGNLWNSNYVPSVSATLQSEMYHHGGIPNQSVNGDNGFLIAHSLRAEGFDASEDGTGRGTPLTVTTMVSGNGDAHSGFRDEHGFVNAGAAVRRLTPTECERLQGFPDGWTKLDDSTPDGPRYKALGNAVTVPVIEFIGRRLMEIL